MNTLYTPATQTLALWIIILGTIIALAMPYVAAMSMRRFKRSPYQKQKVIWVAGEIGLAVAIFTQIVYGIAAYIFCAGTVSPYLWEVSMFNVSLDDPMTMRAFFYWMTPVSMAWILFHYGGLFSIRDLHKTIKEQGDILYAKKMKDRHET